MIGSTFARGELVMDSTFGDADSWEQTAFVPTFGFVASRWISTAASDLMMMMRMMMRMMVMVMMMTMMVMVMMMRMMNMMMLMYT